MSQELKPCPFCGREPEIQSYRFKDARYECINMLCAANGIAATLTEWNTRVDSSLNDRIKVKTYLKIIGDLEAKLKTLQDDQRKGGEDYCNLMERYDDLHNENAALTAKLAVAESELLQWKRECEPLIEFLTGTPALCGSPVDYAKELDTKLESATAKLAVATEALKHYAQEVNWYDQFGQNIADRALAKIQEVD